MTVRHGTNSLPHLKIVEVAQRRAQHLGRRRFDRPVQELGRRAKLEQKHLYGQRRRGKGVT